MMSSKKHLLLLVLSIALVVFVAPFASNSPDGLEWVAQMKGFIHRRKENPTYWNFSPMKDYSISVVSNEAFSTILSGVFGVIATIGCSILIFRRLQRPDDQKK